MPKTANQTIRPRLAELDREIDEATKSSRRARQGQVTTNPPAPIPADPNGTAQRTLDELTRERDARNYRG